ncbi:histidine-type phosphatase [Pseudoduganella sp. FT25W]|uniref:Multiple inositol polyphosphate phosphatase 1 n=1 Tax=Duganella alba TaxID=2666081 RepID=A0A6L5QCX3_9BURK|nr:histidine-type phosphatase [Duganella alba]MRX07616.1 histidine-type phosphatase [Duganella alba]MRX16000.1 histidine-type phosphatase [Duganella alba]
MKPLRLAAGAALFLLLSHAYGEQFYSTKTPYAPQQASASYEAAPAGFKAVYTQMLARHGSRGLSSFKTDLALFNLWQLAAKEDALTPLGRALGPDIEQMMQANALLGYGVDGISKAGYGNETMQGITEHTELAQRLRARLPELFRATAARRIVVVTSGKDRAVDSGYFFARALVRQQPDLKPLIDAGIDRSTLYFHKLSARQDTLVTESSLAYQRWVKSDELKAREAAIHAQPQLKTAAHATLAHLFTPTFIAALDAGQRSASNAGERSYTSADGKFTNTLTGDGDTHIASVTDAALALYDLYSAAADMQAELKADFTPYILPGQARVYAEAEDAVAFYEKGPGIAENGDVTWRMATALVDDFFQEADAIAAGNRAHAAKLRFSHAEIVIPFASALALPGMAEQLPRAATYSYQNSPWRGSQVAPMAANIQWDLYQNAAGRTLVRMLYNEREADFKPACNAARVAPASHFYDYHLLKRCYNQH